MTENNALTAGEICCPNTDELTAQIVSAYVSNNAVPKNDLPDLIEKVRAAIGGQANLGTVAATVGTAQKATPAEIKKSITRDALISFIDGRPYKTLRRHLGKHGYSPESYRAHFGLGFDYPMVAPAYSEKRSAMAKGFGLGRAQDRSAA